MLCDDCITVTIGIRPDRTTTDCLKPLHNCSYKENRTKTPLKQMISNHFSRISRDHLKSVIRVSAFVLTFYMRYRRLDFSMERMANTQKVKVVPKLIAAIVSLSVLVWRQSAIWFTRYAISKIRDQKFYLERAGIARAFLPLCGEKLTNVSTKKGKKH